MSTSPGTGEIMKSGKHGGQTCNQSTMAAESTNSTRQCKSLTWLTRTFVTALTCLLITPAQAQDGIFSVTRTTNSSSNYFAVIDVRPASISQDRLRDELAAAIRVQYDNLQIRNLMVPYPLPTTTPRMVFQDNGGIQVPICNGASTQIVARDSSFTKYGEGTVIQACIFPYQAGYRINYYGFFMQRSGGANPNVLGAMLGRIVTNAIGLGDSSKFIYSTLEELESRLKQLTPETRLVELQPATEGKAVVPDPASPSANQVATAQTKPEQAPQANHVSQSDIQPTAQNTQLTDNKPAENTSETLQARKDLFAMGLTYYSVEQFIAAIRREDILAADLFIKAKGISATQRDKSGTMPIEIAKSPAMKQLLSRQ